MRSLPLFLVLLLCTSGLRGQTLPSEQLARVEYEQKLGSVLPLDTTLRDETGAPLRLGSLFGSRPVLLVLADYECPNLCSVVLNGLLECVRNLRQEAGRNFQVIVISIRPGASAKLAEAKKHTYTTRYGRPGSASGWHFLTGDAASLQALADAVGFHYQYEPKSNQFAHPSGLVVLTPAGQVSRYFLGIEYSPADVHTALAKAGQEKIGSLTQKLLLLCFHYDPSTGRYSLLITRALQVGGLGSVALLAGLILYLKRRERPPMEVRA